MIGADYYEAEVPHPPRNAPKIGIGRDSLVQGAIIDKNARIGAGVTSRPFPKGTEITGQEWDVRDGVVV